jgi:hypothetical protein
MHGVYRGQFTKLLQYIDQEFLPALGTSNDPDARAVYTRWVGGGRAALPCWLRCCRICNACELAIAWPPSASRVPYKPQGPCRAWA